MPIDHIFLLQTLHFPFAVLSDGFEFMKATSAQQDLQPDGSSGSCNVWQCLECYIEKDQTKVESAHSTSHPCSNRITLVNLMPCSGGQYSGDDPDIYRAVKPKVQCMAHVLGCSICLTRLLAGIRHCKWASSDHQVCAFPGKCCFKCCWKIVLRGAPPPTALDRMFLCQARLYLECLSSARQLYFANNLPSVSSSRSLS
jgi:hypothetical protein